MRTVLAIPIDAKVLPDIAARVAQFQNRLAGQWETENRLHIHLAALDPMDSVDEDGPLARALRKASNAQQGFRIELGGLKFDDREAYIPVRRKAGMLQSLAFSVAGRLPDATIVHTEDPWKPKLVVARFSKAPSTLDQLKLEAEWMETRWEMPVKDVAIWNLGDGDPQVLLGAKLTSSGG